MDARELLQVLKTTTKQIKDAGGNWSHFYQLQNRLERAELSLKQARNDALDALHKHLASARLNALTDGAGSIITVQSSQDANQ